MLPLLYVTTTLTAPILVDRITAPANQDLQVTEKIAKVGENTLANKLVYCCVIRDGSFLETCDIISKLRLMMRSQQSVEFVFVSGIGTLVFSTLH